MTEVLMDEGPSECEPDATAKRLVKDLLSDLPKKRRDAITAAIIEAMSEYAREQSDDAALSAVRDYDERN